MSTFSFFEIISTYENTDGSCAYSTAHLKGPFSKDKADALLSLCLDGPEGQLYVPETVGLISARPDLWDDAIDVPFHRIEIHEGSWLEEHADVFENDIYFVDMSIDDLILAFTGKDWHAEGERVKQECQHVNQKGVSVKTYRSRKWLLSDDTGNAIDHTNAFIFCHYGVDKTDKPFHFLKIGDCDQILTYGFTDEAIGTAQDLIRKILLVVNREETFVLITHKSIRYKIQLRDKTREPGEYLMIRSEPRFGDSVSVHIHKDAQTASQEFWDRKMQVLKTELEAFNTFLSSL